MACLRHARAANASTVKEARKATPSWFWQRAACDNATEFIARRLRGGVHGIHRRRPHHHAPP
jgi:predicted chitinase